MSKRVLFANVLVVLVFVSGAFAGERTPSASSPQSWCGVSLPLEAGASDHPWKASQPSSVARRAVFLSAGCDQTCWDQNCPDAYFGCLAMGGSQEACCAAGNSCAHFCGSDCALFCAE